MNETLFSTQEFVTAWIKGHGLKYPAIAIPIRDENRVATMFGIQTASRYGLRSVWLAPNGLYASPGWRTQLTREVVLQAIAQITKFRIEKFVWNVRFDHEPLANLLQDLNFQSTRSYTHALLLSDYESIFSAYNSTTRNQIRRAARDGVKVREMQCDDLLAYYKMHMRLVEQKGGYNSVYPLSLFRHLHRLTRSVRAFVAEIQNTVVAGGFFFIDGNTAMYWHGAADRMYSKHFPTSALIDYAIRWATDAHLKFFNFGGSAGIPSLEAFKGFWGATQYANWVFSWDNPIWQRLKLLKSRLLD